MGVGAMRRAPSDDLSALFDAVAQAPAGWSAFALLRQVEQLSAGAPRIGTALNPADETIDLAHEPELSFPAATIAGFDAGGKHRALVRTRHLGLTGPMGPLPTHLTEMAMAERDARGPRPLGDFLDLISARMLQQFYRAWAEGDPCAQADRRDDDAFAGRLAAISGATSLRFVTGEERGDAQTPGFGDWQRLAYGGHLSGLRSAAAVADLLGHALGQRVRVDETVGQWRDIPGDARTALGARHARLGSGATLGGRFHAIEWDVALRIRVRDMDELEALLPDGTRHALLVEAADAVLPTHLDWHARIEIARTAIRPARIGRARLGLTTWLGTGRHRRPALSDDVRLARRTTPMLRHEGARP